MGIESAPFTTAKLTLYQLHHENNRF